MMLRCTCPCEVKVRAAPRLLVLKSYLLLIADRRVRLELNAGDLLPLALVVVEGFPLFDRVREFSACIWCSGVVSIEELEVILIDVYRLVRLECFLDERVDVIEEL